MMSLMCVVFIDYVSLIGLAMTTVQLFAAIELIL